MRVGATGADVARVQQVLIENGFDCGEDAVHAVFGRDTANAVAGFQAGHLGPASRPLSVDGVVGPATWWALENPTAAAGRPEEPLAPRPDWPAHLVAAHAELGQHEVPNGSNRGPRIDVYTGWQDRPPGLIGPAWCSLFVSYCLAQRPGGNPLGRIANAQNLGHAAAARGWDVTGKPLATGDIFVIARDDLHGHTGFLAAPDGEVAGAWHTIEGNCGNAVGSRVRDAATFARVVHVPAVTRGG